MTEREKKEICKGYADLIIKKEQLIREVWETEFAIRKIENILTRNRILKPTTPEEASEIKQLSETNRCTKSSSTKLRIRRNILRNRRWRTI